MQVAAGREWDGGEGRVTAKGKDTHLAWAGQAQSPLASHHLPHRVHCTATPPGKGCSSDCDTHQLGSEKKARFPAWPPDSGHPDSVSSSCREHPGLCSGTPCPVRGSPRLFSNGHTAASLPTRSVRTHLNSSQERGWQAHQREVGRTPYAALGVPWVALILRLHTTINGKARCEKARYTSQPAPKLLSSATSQG